MLLKIFLFHNKAVEIHRNKWKLWLFCNNLFKQLHNSLETWHQLSILVFYLLLCDLYLQVSYLNFILLVEAEKL